MDFSVLIVDDDPKIAEIHRHFTEKVNGFNVCGVAGSLEDAHKSPTWYCSTSISRKGWEPRYYGNCARRQQTDVILITAAKELEPLQEAMHGGVFDYILKPVMFPRFKETLERFRKHRLQLQTDGALNQQDIDRLLHPYKNRGPGEPEYPKGIDPLILKKVREAFEQPHPDGLSAEEVGRWIGASRTTARRYLEFLTANGHLSAELIYGAVGRPERKYSQAEATRPST